MWGALKLYIGPKLCSIYLKFNYPAAVGQHTPKGNFSYFSDIRDISFSTSGPPFSTII